VALYLPALNNCPAAALATELERKVQRDTVLEGYRFRRFVEIQPVYSLAMHIMDGRIN
jgi:hypothetical protein